MKYQRLHIPYDSVLRMITHSATKDLNREYIKV